MNKHIFDKQIAIQTEKLFRLCKKPENNFSFYQRRKAITFRVLINNEGGKGK